jgi:hypothetical protein
MALKKETTQTKVCGYIMIASASKKYASVCKCGLEDSEYFFSAGSI